MSLSSRHELLGFVSLLGDLSLSRNKCDTYLISSGLLFEDLRSFRTFFNSFTLESLYLFTKDVSGTLLLKPKFSAKYPYTVSFNCWMLALIIIIIIIIINSKKYFGF